MGIYLLSARGIVSSVSYDPLFELEDIWAESLGADILVPIQRGLVQQLLARPKSSSLRRLGLPLLRRTVTLYDPIQPGLARAESNILIVMALCGAELEMVMSIPQWRQQFDCVVGYVFDAWHPEYYPQAVRQLDHLFVPMPEIIPELQQAFGIPVSLLPFGTDALGQGSADAHRPIDLLSYGRIPPLHHQVFMQRFNTPGSQRLYYRLTPRPAQRFPQFAPAMQRSREDTAYLYHVLRKTKLVLAYDTLYPGMRQFPHSFLTLRWFQGGATGCTIIGHRPTTPLADDLLDWPDSTIEFPEDMEDCVEMIENLLADRNRLHQISQRNYLQNLRRHDWRLRLQELLQRLGLESPPQLRQQLEQIHTRVEQLQTHVAPLGIR
jgi:hypothetical protein